MRRFGGGTFGPRAGHLLPALVTSIVLCLIPGAAAQALSIHVSYDSSVGSAPIAFKSAFASAVQLFETTFTDPVTININVGYGEVNGTSLDSNVAGQSLTYLAGPLTYSGVKSTLSTDSASVADTTAVGSLGSADPTGGGNFVVSTAQAKALNLISNDSFTDGYVGFSSSLNFSYDPNNRGVAGQYDFIGVAQHEVSEVMGRIALLGADLGSVANTYSVLDLFRYSASDTRQLVGGQTAYFSINGGTTDLLNFNKNGNADFGDWAGTTVDAANAFASIGALLPFSATDITEMNVIGYDVAAAAPSSVPIPDSIVLLGSGLLGLGAIRRRKRGPA